METKQITVCDAIFIDVSCERNDWTDIKCGGPAILGYEFYVSPDEDIEMVKNEPKKIIQEKPITKEEDFTEEKSKKIKTSINDIIEKWNDLIEEVKPANHSIHAFLKNCVPAGIAENKLYIKTKYDFYKDKLNEPNNKLTVQKSLAKITGEKLQISIITEKESQKIAFKEEEKNSKEKNAIYDAMQIIGGKLVS